MAGYHKSKIPKGELGEFSKIQEEFYEAADAYSQDDKILILCELSDMIGAMEAYLHTKHNMDILDLKRFSDKTKEAFKDGTR